MQTLSLCSVSAKDSHDRADAFAAFEAAQTRSPASALTDILGSVILGWAGEPQRVIEWAGARYALEPIRTPGCLLLIRGRYQEPAAAAYKAVQSNPADSISYMLLAAPVAKLGRLDEKRRLQLGLWHCNWSFCRAADFRA